MSAAVNDDDLRNAFARGLYFHAVGGPLTHNTGCLIEGALELGIPVTVSTPQITSRVASMPLLGVDLKPLVAPPRSGLSGYIVDITHTNAFVPFDGIGGAPLAYVNQSDIATFSRLPDDQLMFVAHENRFVGKGGVRHPLAFGLSNGLMAATNKRAVFAERRRCALRNFRATLSQSVRALLDLTYVPALAKHMPVERAVTGPPVYLQSLLNSNVCLAYGGDFYAPIMENRWFQENDPALANLHRFARLDAPGVILRWDSFRLWESLAAGCVTVHLDFEKYGFNLPVAPVPWEHYAPIDLDNIASSVEQLMDHGKAWAEIAEGGRAWATTHYAPKPTLARVLAAMSGRRSVAA